MFLLLWASILAGYSAGAERRLVMVHAIWRHGDRTPITSIPTDRNNTPETWYQGLGELVPNGLEQQWQLGELLRLRYQDKYDFINRSYVQNEIYVRSSDYNRTLMSAYATLAGFYANAPQLVKWSKWPAYWQPVPVHTIPQNDDYFLRLSTPCQRVVDIQKSEVWPSQEYVGNTTLYQDVFDHLNQHAKVPFKVNLNTIWQLADPLEVEERHGRQWPNYINRTMFDRIKKVHNVGNHFLFCNRKIQRFRGGPLIGEMASRMLQKRTSLTSSANDPKLAWIRKLKFYAYSAHDMTILAVLENLGAVQFTRGEMPGFATCVVFELWQEGNQFEIQAFYRYGPSGNDFIPIPIKGCPESGHGKCSLDAFYEQSKDRIPSNWFAECKNRAAALRSFGATFLQLVIIILAIFYRLEMS